MLPSRLQQPSSKPPDSERKTANRYPSTVMPALRRRIIGSLRAGRSAVQVAKEYNVTQACVLEIFLRSIVTELEIRLANIEDSVPPDPPLAQIIAFRRAA